MDEKTLIEQLQFIDQEIKRAIGQGKDALEVLVEDTADYLPDWAHGLRPRSYLQGTLHSIEAGCKILREMLGPENTKVVCDVVMGPLTISDGTHPEDGSGKPDQ